MFMDTMNVWTQNCWVVHIYPWMCSRNLSGHFHILRWEILKKNSHGTICAHKVWWLENFDNLKLWPTELSITFHIIPILGWLRRSCRIFNLGRYEKIVWMQRSLVWKWFIHLNVMYEKHGINRQHIYHSSSIVLGLG